ncbi:MAG: hypothetical protein AB8B64_08310 [Granulosicoccus sp.]
MKSKTSEFAIEHQILVLDAYLHGALDCDLQQSITQNFIIDAMGTLGLEPLGSLGIFPAVDERAPGWSFIQPITTSHISGHYFEKPGKSPHIRIDAYSCDQIDWKTFIQVCSQHFDLADWRATFIEREIDAQQTRPILTLEGSGDHISYNQKLESSSSPGHSATNNFNHQGESNACAIL